MGKRSPSIPYPIDFDTYLTVYTFDKARYQKKDVERVIRNFINRLTVQSSSRSRRKKIVLWRGEYTNQFGIEMYVLGIPTNCEYAIHQELFKAVGDKFDEVGDYQRVDTGCQPYLLIFYNQLWMFDAMKPPRSEGTLVLAETAFPVRYLPCTHSASNGEWVSMWAMMGEEIINTKLFDCLEIWKAVMSNSASKNRPLVQGGLSDLALGTCLSKNHRLLREICQDILRIPVFDIPMQEYGRTIVRPIWSEDEDNNAFFVSDYSVAIAIKEDLSEKQKLLSLAHELGHFVCHYPYLVFFSQLFFLVQDDPSIEFSLATQFPEQWWEFYYRTTERSADTFASYFIIPDQIDAALEALNEITYRGELPYSTDAQRLHWIRNFFETEKQIIGWHQMEQLVEATAQERSGILAQGYLPDKTLFERVVWCLLQRRNHFYQEMIKEEERKIQEKLELVPQSLLQRTPPGQTIQSGEQRLFIKRLNLQSLWEEFSSGKEQWDPIIVESTEKSKIQGYIGLIPSLYTKANTASMDWTLWEAPRKAPNGCLEVWIKLAMSQEKGIMLFPLSPLDTHLRGLNF